MPWHSSRASSKNFWLRDVVSISIITKSEKYKELPHIAMLMSCKHTYCPLLVQDAEMKNKLLKCKANHTLAITEMPGNPVGYYCRFQRLFLLFDTQNVTEPSLSSLCPSLSWFVAVIFVHCVIFCHWVWRKVVMNIAVRTRGLGGSIPSDSGIAIIFGQSYFSGRSQQPKWEKYFCVFIKRKNGIIPSSEIKCPKSGIFANTYWVRWVGQSNFAS